MAAAASAALVLTAATAAVSGTAAADSPPQLFTAAVTPNVVDAGSQNQQLALQVTNAASSSTPIGEVLVSWPSGSFSLSTTPTFVTPSSTGNWNLTCGTPTAPAPCSSSSTSLVLMIKQSLGTTGIRSGQSLTINLRGSFTGDLSKSPVVFSTRAIGSTEFTLAPGSSQPSVTLRAVQPTALTVAFPANTSVTAGTPVTLAVTAVAGATRTPTNGTVQLTTSDSAPQPTCQMTNGTASCPVTFTRSGNQVVTASLVGTTGVTGQASTTVSPATATRLGIVSSPAGTSAVTAGSDASFVVTAYDRFDNVATGFAGELRLVTNDPAVGSSGTASYPAPALSQGTGTFTLVPQKSQSSFTVSAQSTGLTSASTSITVRPAAPATLRLTGLPAPSVTSGTPFSVTVTSLDQYGNQTTSSAPLTVSLAGGSAVGGVSLVNGQATVSATGGVAGQQLLSVSDGSLTATATIQVDPGPAVALLVATSTSAVAAGTGNVTATVTAIDAAGNSGAVYAGTPTVTARLSGSSAAVTAPTSPGGGAVTLSLTTAGTWTLSASDGAISSPPSGGSNPTVVVSAGGAAQLAITPPTNSQVTAGTPASFGVTVQDNFQNTVAGGGTLTATSTDPKGTSGSSTFSGGTGTVSSTLRTPGAQTVTITATPTGASAVTALVPVTVVAGSPAVLRITSVTDASSTPPQPQPVEGKPFTTVVELRDSSGNLTSFASDTAVSLAAAPAGLTGGTGTFLAGASSATITGASYSPSRNGVLLTATAGGLTSASFSTDVSSVSTVFTSTPGTSQTVSNTQCGDNGSPTTADPMCFKVLLPKGGNGTGYLLQQQCDPFTPCITSAVNQGELASLVVSLRDASGKPLYTRSSPATIITLCDKTLCPGTGVSNFTMTFQPTGSTQFLTVPACPSKGTIGANQDFCADYRQSSRNGVGDLQVYLLFLDDLKTTIR